MTVERPKPKQLLWPITTGAGSAMNQSQFLAIRCNSLDAREKSRVHGAIGFGFASHWLKNWRESLKPITTRSNRNHVITFDSHLKTALTARVFLTWINFRYCPDYFGKKAFGPGFFLRLGYLFKVRTLGALLAHGRQKKAFGTGFCLFKVRKLGALFSPMDDRTGE